MNKGDTWYKIGFNLEVIGLTCVHKSKGLYVLQDREGQQFNLKQVSINKLNPSRIMAYTELEEILRERLEKTHEVLRSHKVKYNSITPFDVVISPVHNPAKPVHQYDSKTGRYIQTFLSVRDAVRAVAPTGTQGTSNLHSVCAKKKRPNGYTAKSAYGFRWSYEKLNRIQ